MQNSQTLIQLLQYGWVLMYFPVMVLCKSNQLFITPQLVIGLTVSIVCHLHSLNTPPFNSLVLVLATQIETSVCIHCYIPHTVKTLTKVTLTLKTVNKSMYHTF